MLRIVIAGFAFGMMSSAAIASDYCDGFEAGYAEGYCYQETFCLKPLPPLCPLPRLGESTFQDGYNRGFLLGVANKR